MGNILGCYHYWRGWFVPVIMPGSVRHTTGTAHLSRLLDDKITVTINYLKEKATRFKLGRDMVGRQSP